MSKYRKCLPQLGDQAFLTDGGLETTLVFLRRMELPFFAAFDLLKSDEGVEVLREYFDPYLEIARRYRRGFILETPTWRANPDWAEKLGYDSQALADANRKAVGLLLEIRRDRETPEMPLVISGNIGPRGDGYQPDRRMTAEEARLYHSEQVQTFSQTDADMITAMTINYIEEAIGIVKAARDTSMPVVISFTVETNGRLPTGDTLGHAITRTDEATGGYAKYFMINCAHPTHFSHVLKSNTTWRERIRGLRANASMRSHTELDESTDLDAGNPEALGQEYRQLQALLPRLTVLGGCCGTDHRHLGQIAHACYGTAGDQQASGWT